MKKTLALLLALAMVFGLVACSSSDEPAADEGAESGSTELVEQYTYDDSIYDEYKEMVDGLDVSQIKLGFIMVGDESEGYTEAHYEGVKTMCDELGIDMDSQVIIKWNIGEDEGCYEAAVELVEAGCDIVFGNSFGHEDYLLQAAAEFPDVQFCHATGYQAASSGLSNISNYFVDVYQSRYASGVVAGVKLLQMIDAGDVDGTKEIPVGYVGAYSYAEVVSGYTAFYLGLMSVASEYDVELYVTYTGSWASESLEYDAAISLIDEQKCVLVSQHADTTGAPSACEERGVYCVGYNVSMNEAAPNYSLTSASLNWGVFYTYAAASMLAGKGISTDWTASYSDGAVFITEINRGAFDSDEAYNEAVTKANDATSSLLDGSLKVFDTSKFTVGGETLTTTASDDLADSYYGVEHIKTEDGVSYFAESEIGSAPAFAFRIDGITELNTVY